MIVCVKSHRHATGTLLALEINGNIAGINQYTIVKFSHSALIVLLLTLVCGRQSAIANESLTAVADTNADIRDAANSTAPSENAGSIANATLSLWDLGQHSLINSEQALRTFSAQTDIFLNEPSAEGLAQVQQEWRNSHEQWQQQLLWITLANKHAETFAELKLRYFAIDARDLQPGYLDAVQDYPFSGIVNDISILLNADNLRQQHGLTDNSEVSLGFHALELLLWGEQGQRQFSDFQAIAAITSEQNAAGLTTVDLANNRRRTLLRLIGQLLADDIQRLRQDWQNPQSVISQSYLRLAPPQRHAGAQQAVAYMLSVELIGQLGQLNHSDKYNHHNQFAGDTYRSSLASLNGLEHLLISGETPLLNSLLQPAEAIEWQQQLRLQIAAVSELSNDSSEVAAGKIAQITVQLKQLARAIQPQSPADS